LASFLGRARKEGPAGRPHLNQRAEGTKKIFLTLVSAYGVSPALQIQKSSTTLKKSIYTEMIEQEA
jgi:hypothetical protein